MKVFIVLAALALSAYAKPSSPRVIGGEDAERDQYPYQVSVQQSSFLGSSHICGGSVLSSKYVVTAGHCIVSDNLIVKAGLLHQKDKENVQKVNVAKAIVHPKFSGGVGPNDIAILVLASELELNDHVKAINLPEADKTFAGDVVLTGWGKTSNGIFAGVAETLQTVTLPVLTDEECAGALAAETGSSQPFAPESNICTGPLSGGHSACNGDSGGPLVQDNTLVGIVSWGYVPCASKGMPAIFTEVSHFLDFIKENTP